MNNLVDDILEKIDIVELISEYVTLKRVGKNYHGLCPFHNEKTPSFTVAPDKQIFKCFGCGVGGNAYKFLMEFENIDFPQVLKLLAPKAGIDISNYTHKASDTDQKKDLKEKIRLINLHVSDFFQEAFMHNNKIQEYTLQQRKLNLEIVKKFNLGYAPDTHYELINFLKNKGFDENDILQAGIAKRGSTGDLYSFFRNRLIFPIADQLNNIVAFAGRALNAQDTPKYLNSPETLIYDKSKILYGLNIAKNHIKKYQALIIVEGYMDVIALARGDMPIGVASCGTALTIHHLKQALRISNNIIFAFDNDQAGQEATRRSCKIAFQLNCFPKNISLPVGIKDLDELVNSNLENLKDIIINAQDSFEFLTNLWIGQFNLNDMTSRNNLNAQIFDLLLNIKDYGVFIHYLELFARKSNIDIDILMRQFKQFQKGQKSFSPMKDKDKPKFVIEDKYLFTALFYQDFLIKNQLLISHIPKYSELITEISNYVPDNNIFLFINNNLKSEEIEMLLSAQIWWEQNLITLTQTKKEEHIHKFIRKQFNNYLKLILKLPNISLDHKQSLLGLAKYL